MNDSPSAVVRVSELTLRYGATCALDDVSLEIRPTAWSA